MKCPNCPDCGTLLILVEQSPKSLLNEYQWEAIKAGDYYCTSCKPTEDGLKYRYFWESQFSNENKKQVTGVC